MAVEIMTIMLINENNDINEMFPDEDDDTNYCNLNSRKKNRGKYHIHTFLFDR
jgi:hypothetical protein